jgi:hypothetical protein
MNNLMNQNTANNAVLVTISVIVDNIKMDFRRMEWGGMY